MSAHLGLRRLHVSGLGGSQRSGGLEPLENCCCRQVDGGLAQQLSTRAQWARDMRKRRNHNTEIGYIQTASSLVDPHFTGQEGHQAPAGNRNKQLRSGTCSSGSTCVKSMYALFLLKENQTISPRRAHKQHKSSNYRGPLMRSVGHPVELKASHSHTYSLAPCASRSLKHTHLSQGAPRG